MRYCKILALLCCVFLVLTALEVKTTRADEFNKKTIFTFSAPVEIPGYKTQMVLPAGTYVFKLLDSISNRDIVQIFNKSEDHLYATILAIPDYRMTPTDKPVIMFGERAAGSPAAIKAWFYPGDTYGQEFVYPKTRAVQLAKNTTEPVLSMSDEMASNIAKSPKSANETSVKAMEKAPVMAEQPGGQEVEMAQVISSPPPGSSNTRNTTNKELPKTGSTMPTWGLIGMLLCCVGAGLRILSRRTA